MKVIIAGSRSLTNYNMVEIGMAEIGITDKITCVVSGGARGVDKLGEAWAERHKKSCEVYSANWDKFGKSAGYKRNVVMAKHADILVAFWDGISRGTKHMIRTAEDNDVFVIAYHVIGNKLRKYPT